MVKGPTQSPLEGHDKVCVGRQISQAVAYLHNLKLPVVPRGIKPTNVLVAKGLAIQKQHFSVEDLKW